MSRGVRARSTPNPPPSSTSTRAPASKSEAASSHLPTHTYTLFCPSNHRSPLRLTLPKPIHPPARSGERQFESPTSDVLPRGQAATAREPALISSWGA
jgi:hypothetical protein